jgi:hypothetical protein
MPTRIRRQSESARRQNLSDNNGMERDELKEYAHSLVNELTTRQLEAVVGILQVITGRDESDTIPEAAGGEGLPPEDLFNKFFS